MEILIFYLVYWFSFALLFHAYIDRVYVPLELNFSFEYIVCVFDIGFITHWKLAPLIFLNETLISMSALKLHVKTIKFRLYEHSNVYYQFQIVRIIMHSYWMEYIFIPSHNLKSVKINGSILCTNITHGKRCSAV